MATVTRRVYDTLTHRLKSIVTTKNLQDLSCDYDYFGNLAARKDNLRNMEERFTYTDTYARPKFDRGFTGHEHLQAFGLINMNGRMYDPVMSSFLSADRYIQDPTGWVAGVGGGHHSNGPLKQVLVDGQPRFELPEVTITPYEDTSYILVCKYNHYPDD